MNSLYPRPTFSVIIGCYNHRKFIEETVNSVRAQSYPALQIIVVDDNSPDDSISVIRTLGPDVTIVASEVNRGGSSARNSGAAGAKGDYLIFLDGDDSLTPWALEAYATIVSREKPSIILASMFFFSGSTVQESALFFNGSEPIHNYDGFSKEIIALRYSTLARKDRKFRSSGSSIVFSRQAFKNCGGWTSDIFPGEDTDIQLKLLSTGPVFHVLSPPTAYYRVHADNTMKQVARFIAGLNKVVARAKGNYYYRYGSEWIDVYSLLGGEVLFWCKSAFKARQPLLATKLFAKGLPIIFVAAARRALKIIRGRLTPIRFPPVRVVSENVQSFSNRREQPSNF